MWMTATLHAYDVMDQVMITVTISGQEEPHTGTIETLFHTATTIPSQGAATPHEWLRDVLCEAFEIT